MTETNKIQELNIEHKSEVLELLEEAEQYLRSFKWCNKIVNGWLAKEFGFILCIFSFEILPTENSGADSRVWVIVGDIPPAYIDIVSATTAQEALSSYCFLMEDWIEHVKSGKSVDECYPIDAPATDEYADMLQSRVELIKSDYLPFV